MNPLDAYKETKIKTASQGKLIVMLYDEAIKNIDIGIGLLKDKGKELDRVNDAIIKAQDVITELATSLDFERGGDIAANLFSLYMYFNQQLLNANIQKKINPLEEVRRMLADLRDAWSVIDKQAATPESQPSIRGVNIAG